MSDTDLCGRGDGGHDALRAEDLRSQTGGIALLSIREHVGTLHGNNTSACCVLGGHETSVVACRLGRDVSSVPRDCCRDPLLVRSSLILHGSSS